MAKNVVVYSKANCGNCVAVKMYFKGRGVSFEEIAVDQDKEALDKLRAKGVRALPFITIDDVEIKGFKPEEIEKALG